MLRQLSLNPSTFLLTRHRQPAPARPECERSAGRLHAQGSTIPVIIIAQEGMQMDIIQAFRLGATDVLLSPVRDTEVITAVERALTQSANGASANTWRASSNRPTRICGSVCENWITIAQVGEAVNSLVDQRHLFDSEWSPLR